MKAFYGDLEDASSVCKKQAIAARYNYKRRIGVKKVKPERNNKHIERTNISKIVTKTSRLDHYMDMKERIREIQKGKTSELTLEQVLDKLFHRKVGERMIRVSTPIARLRDDDVASPKAKNYNQTDSQSPSRSTQQQLPVLQNKSQMNMKQADSQINARRSSLTGSTNDQ